MINITKFRFQKAYWKKVTTVYRGEKTLLKVINEVTKAKLN